MGGHRAILPVRYQVWPWSWRINTSVSWVKCVIGWLLAIDAENRKILWRLGQTKNKGMGTTIEVLALLKQSLWFSPMLGIHVLLISVMSSMKQLTSDHSFGQCSYQGLVSWPKKKQRFTHNVISLRNLLGNCSVRQHGNQQWNRRLYFG